MVFAMNFKIRYTCLNDSSTLLKNSKSDFSQGEEMILHMGSVVNREIRFNPESSRVIKVDAEEGVAANIYRIYKEETSEVKEILDKLTSHILLLKMCHYRMISN